jgi:hypothetical protein
MPISALRKKRRMSLIVTIVAAAVLVFATTMVISFARAGLEVHGVAEGGVVGAPGLREMSITAGNRAAFDHVEVSVDGTTVPVHRDGDRVVVDAPRLVDGPHTLVARTRNHVPLLFGAEATRSFTVDSTAPKLSVDPVTLDSLRKPVTIRGTAEGAESLSVQDHPVPLDDNRQFTVTLPTAPATLRVQARDEAGNTEQRELPVHVRHPGMRAVHMTAMAWADASLREPVLKLAREHKIDTVELDIKDESGEIGYNSEVPLARQIGANKNYYDARSALNELHAVGLRVVGRLVAFRDPVLAQASWEKGAKDFVIQDSSGTPWSGDYGQYTFTNFANPEVRAYNIAIASEAAALGFDDILYDYVRRPDGPRDRMRFPGLDTTPEQAIATFMQNSRTAVRSRGAFLGASVFGIAAKDAQEVAQDIPAMAKHADYIAPMVYPSHWSPDEYDVADPEGQPHDIVQRSLKDFITLTKDTDAGVIPWLQAFSLGRAYGPSEVQAQITAAVEDGIESFLLWDSSCQYDSAGLQPR